MFEPDIKENESDSTGEKLWRASPVQKGPLPPDSRWLTLARQAQDYNIFHCLRKDEIQIKWNPMIFKGKKKGSVTVVFKEWSEQVKS